MSNDLTLYRVWPDGYTQDTEEAPPSHRSDDYMEILAVDEEAAQREADVRNDRLNSLLLNAFDVLRTVRNA